MITIWMVVGTFAPIVLTYWLLSPVNDPTFTAPEKAPDHADKEPADMSKFKALAWGFLALCLAAVVVAAWDFVSLLHRVF